MVQKIMLFLLNLALGGVCVAAGYITNQNFNELIETTRVEQRTTAHAIMESASTEAGLQNYLNERPRAGTTRTY